MSAQIAVWLQIAQLLILLIGVVAPNVWAVLRLRAMLQEYPLHRHLNGHIIYPKGDEPGRMF